MIVLTLDDIMGAVAYNAYYMAPNHAPRKIEVVMKEVREYLKEHLEQPLEHDKTFYAKHFEAKEIYPFIKDMLMSIEEYQEWNLTQIEYEKGIKVDDENRPKYCFCSRYDVHDEEDWKNSFIDLDAFVQNTVNVLQTLRD